jgi:hypothetical protein
MKTCTRSSLLLVEQCSATTESTIINPALYEIRGMISRSICLSSMVIRDGNLSTAFIFRFSLSRLSFEVKYFIDVDYLSRIAGISVSGQRSALRGRHSRRLSLRSRGCRRHGKISLTCRILFRIFNSYTSNFSSITNIIFYQSVGFACIY